MLANIVFMWYNNSIAQPSVPSAVSTIIVHLALEGKEPSLRDKKTLFHVQLYSKRKAPMPRKPSRSNRLNECNVQTWVEARWLAMCKLFLEKKYDIVIESNYSLNRHIIEEFALLARRAGIPEIKTTHEALHILQSGGIENLNPRGRMVQNRMKNLQQDLSEEEETSEGEEDMSKVTERIREVMRKMQESAGK